MSEEVPQRRPTPEQVESMTTAQIVEAMQAQNESKQDLGASLSQLITSVAHATGNDPNGFGLLDARVALNALVKQPPCEHGYVVPHRWGGPPADPDWEEFPRMPNVCIPPEVAEHLGGRE